LVTLNFGSLNHLKKSPAHFSPQTAVGIHGPDKFI